MLNSRILSGIREEVTSVSTEKGKPDYTLYEVNVTLKQTWKIAKIMKPQTHFDINLTAKIVKMLTFATYCFI